MQNSQTPRPDDHRRMTIFFLCAAVIMIFSYFFITKPQMEKARAEAAVRAQAAEAVQMTEKKDGLVPLDEALKEAKRLTLETPKMAGSVSLKGLRFDDVELKDYYTTLENTQLVRLLSPHEAKGASFVEIGLMPADKSTAVPTNDTQWHVVSGEKLTPETPVILEWENASGVSYRRTISVDRRYVVTVLDEVTNNGSQSLTFYPYALVSQTHHRPLKGEKVAFEDQDSGVQHTGPIGYLNEKLEEESYKNVSKEGMYQYSSVKGWLGITGKYWLTALLPPQDKSFDARYAHQKGDEDQDIYQVDLRGTPLIVAANETAKSEMRFFAGAKKLEILDDYEEQLAIPKLELAVDFGVLYILTKPLYHVLSFLGNYLHEEYQLTVSFGIALLLLTVLVRAATFPLQNKSYRSMNKMKDLAPKMEELKLKFGNDKVKFQEEVLALYKREKVNPASGCLPIFLQIPIFFALYKVIYITIDMRHAPFWGWVHDLSSPDPTNLFNLFGLLPFNTPAFLVVGAWPLLYGFTMWMQQELNPKPEDEMQRQVFAMLPWIFTFVFAKFPAGLVIYYTWSNLLGIVQQHSLRKIHGTPVPPRKSKDKKKTDDKTNATTA